jgi:hypothetical protein
MTEVAPFVDLLKDPARRAESARAQEEARERWAHVVKRTPAQANYLFGLARAERALKADEVDADVLAEAFALQGRFAEAAALTTEEERREGYVARARAIETTGAFTCDCPAELITPSPADAKGKREPMRHPVETVYDGTNEFTISRCRKCGALSAEVTG